VIAAPKRTIAEAWRVNEIESMPTNIVEERQPGLEMSQRQAAAAQVKAEIVVGPNNVALMCHKAALPENLFQLLVETFASEVSLNRDRHRRSQ
jgi:hypothetical protein